MNVNQIALELYTVREQTKRDMLGTLKELARMGYRAVEFAGYGGVAVQDIRATLEQQGMRAIAAHLPYEQLDTQFQQVAADMHILGSEYVVLPSIPGERRQNAAQVKQLAERFNRWGELCRVEGLAFAYHNHAFEFAPLEGSSVWEILTTATDPALVELELDVYWVQFAGVDPVELMRRHAGRIPLLHVKDMGSDSARSDAPVGEGVLPWQALLVAGELAGVRWYIVEQDHPRDALEDVRRSLHNLQRLMGG